ncbi:MAG: oligosaccharide flippase family protein, partial [Candidatus Hodarchaeota archaeon]
MSISINTFKNFLIISITEFIGFFANFITIYLLTHLYPPNEFGLYSFSFTFISFFTIIINFGLGSTLVRNLSA